MRSKAPLAMMEEMVMILVFALAAALCLQAFVKSDQMSKASEARDHAAVLCQSAAEAIRACGENGAAGNQALERAADMVDGIYSPGQLWVNYDEDWTPIHGSDDAPAYWLYAVTVDSGVEGLSKAHVVVVSPDTPYALFELEVAWQEVIAP